MRKPLAPATETVPNLAPMVDVIMVLLVFFLLGATLNLTEQGVLQTELDPRSGPGAGVATQINPRIVIGLRARDGGESVAIVVVDTPLGVNTFDALYHFLRQRRDMGADLENPIVLGAEPTVRWHFVVQAMDAAVRAGFANIQFAVSLAPADD